MKLKVLPVVKAFGIELKYYSEVEVERYFLFVFEEFVIVEFVSAVSECFVGILDVLIFDAEFAAIDLRVELKPD